MKAAIYNPYFDTLGGGERYTSMVIKYLLDRGDSVDIWFGHNMTRPIKERFGIDISQANFINEGNSQDYDLLFWVSDGSLPSSQAGKTVVHFQFPFHDVGGKSFKNLIKSRRYKFVVNSFFTKRFVDREYMISSTVVYPPVDTTVFVPLAKKDTILFVGRFSNLTQSKGHEVLIDTFKNISNSLPGWRLVLAGGTTVGTRDDYIAHLRDLSESSPIELVTDPSLVQLQKLYGEAKIFCSASGFGHDEEKEPEKVEHFGMSVAESMSAGCVPVVVNLGGHKEIVAHDVNGLLWNSTHQLEKLLVELVRDGQRMESYSQNAREKSKLFDVTSFHQNLDSVL